MKKLGVDILVIIAVVAMAGAVQAAPGLTAEQCAGLLKRFAAGESVFVGPAERECLNTPPADPEMQPAPVEQPVARPTVAAADPQPVPAWAESFLAADNAGKEGVTGSPLPVIDDGVIREKVYDTTPFEKQLEKILPDLLHHEDASAIPIEGSGRVMVRDDGQGHRNVENALDAFRDRYLVAYDLSMEEWIDKWSGGADKKISAAGQISPVTSPQSLGGWLFSLRCEGGKTILDIKGQRDMETTSLIFPIEGGLSPRFTKNDKTYNVTLTSRGGVK